MKAVSNFSVRLDGKVPIFLLVVSSLALLITAFRFNSDEPCNGFTIDAYSNHFDVGSTVFFSTKNAKNARTWEWNFGDNTPLDKTSGTFANHIYTQPGRYIITLTINNQCKQLINININNVIKDTLQKIYPTVIWPTGPIMVGQNLVFSDNTNGAHRWDWYFGEGKNSKQFNTKDVSFTFQSPGPVIVKLFINGDPNTFEERTIDVLDIPEQKIKAYTANPNNVIRPPKFDIKDKPSDESIFGNDNTGKPEAQTVSAPRLTNALFLSMVKGVVDKTVMERDFEPYLCGNKNVRVSFNGDDISFPECIQRLRKIKKFKSLKANAYTDRGTNCILGISIVYDKKTILGL